MNDQELLELAAKAAGMQLDTYYLGRPEFSNGLILARGQTHPSKGSTVWNPLTDDGDALRLAVKLRISPDFNPNASTGVFTGYELVQSGKRGYHNPIVENFGDDDLAATRRAIVRRAAAIGKSMATAPEARS